VAEEKKKGKTSKNTPLLLNCYALEWH